MRWQLTVGAAAAVCLMLAGAATGAGPPEYEEGPVTRGVSIQGNRALSRSAVRMLMNTRAIPWYAWVPGVERPRFDAGTFRLDVARIQASYRDLGYFQARIDTVVDRSRPDGVRISIRIAEGPVTTVGAVAVEGLPTDGDSVMIAGELSVELGKPLLKSSLDADRDRLRSRLQERGYAFADVSARVDVDPEAHRAAVRYTVEPGPACRYGTIRLGGNGYLPERVLRKGLAFGPGEVYRKRELDASRRRLFRLPGVRSVILGIPDTASRSSPVAIHVSVSERPVTGMKAGVGLATEERLRGSFAWQHRSFLGGARQLIFQSSASSLERSASATLRQPYVWSNRTWLSLSASVRRDDRLAYRVSRTRLSLSLDRDLGNTASMATQLANEWIDFRADSTVTDLRIVLRQDSRDDLFDPSAGWWGSASLEESGSVFTSDNEFVKVVAEGRWYVRAGPSLVIAFRMSGGLIARLTGASEIVSFKRFYAGGSNSVRGWPLDGLGPHDASGDPVGGRSLLEGSLELRPRLSSFLGAALFLDAGNVGRNYGAFNPMALKLSGGLGLRYISPIGPVRVDAAYPLSEDPVRPAALRYYFSLGQAF